MSTRRSPSTDRPYGLARVTRIWGLCRATVYRHRRPEEADNRRPGPLGAMNDRDLVARIRDVIGAGGFHGEGYRKVWARRRFAGVRTSRRRVLRLMREHGLLAFQRLGAARGPRAHDGTIITERVDTMWGADLTTVMTGEGAAAVFIAVDHCSSECVGIHAARRGAPPASKRWSRSGRGCANASAPLQRMPPLASPCATITEASMSRMPFRRS